MSGCNGTDNQAYMETWYNPRMGALYAVMGVGFATLYVPCIIVMTDKDLWKNTCYQLMFIVGVMDTSTLVVSAILPSVFMFIPLGIDCYPLLNQILACWICQLFWNGCCFANVTLVLNRCVFMASPSKWHEKLFADGRVWIWAAATVVYGAIYVAVYASPYGMIQFHSGIGIYIWPTTDEIGLKFATFNNTATAVLIPIGYVVLAIIIRQKRSLASTNSAQTTAAEKRLLLQAVLICSPTCIASLFYVFAPMLTSDVVVFQVLHVIWIFSNGVNGLVYLTLNKTIRGKIPRLIGMDKLVKGGTSTRVMPLNVASSPAA